MKFLRSRYVLVLLLTVLVIEVAIRMGVYEPVVSPASHSGKTITLKMALNKFGKAQVDVLTFGDSRAAYGLNNRMIYEASREHGLNHVRLSMPGSHLLTYKVLANWSLDEISGLQGIVLAVSPESFGNLGNGAYELAKVLPLRNQTSIGEMLHHVPFSRSDVRTYAPFYTVGGYREDIKDLLTNPAMRLQSLRKRNKRDPLYDLAFNGQASSSICYVSTANPVECLEELEHLQADIPQRARTGLEVLCKAAARERKARAPAKREHKLIDEWLVFLEKLSRQVRVMLVILPDHSIRPEHIYQANALYVADAVVAQLRAKGGFDVVDLRNLLTGRDEQECEFYMDAVHLNKKGKHLLTTALIPELEQFWDTMQ